MDLLQDLIHKANVIQIITVWMYSVFAATLLVMIVKSQAEERRYWIGGTCIVFGVAFLIQSLMRGR